MASEELSAASVLLAVSVLMGRRVSELRESEMQRREAGEVVGSVETFERALLVVANLLVVVVIAYLSIEGSSVPLTVAAMASVVYFLSLAVGLPTRRRIAALESRSRALRAIEASGVPQTTQDRLAEADRYYRDGKVIECGRHTVLCLESWLRWQGLLGECETVEDLKVDRSSRAGVVEQWRRIVGEDLAEALSCFSRSRGHDTGADSGALEQKADVLFRRTWRELVRVEWV